MPEYRANPTTGEIKYPEQLQALLTSILGTPNVYYQPPSSKRMSYPCIVYQLDRVDTQYGDNLPYRMAKAYSVTYIDRDPDSTIPDILGSLPKSSFMNFRIADDLNHWTYRIYHKEVPTNA